MSWPIVESWEIGEGTRQFSCKTSKTFFTIVDRIWLLLAIILILTSFIVYIFDFYDSLDIPINDDPQVMIQQDETDMPSSAFTSRRVLLILTIPYFFRLLFRYISFLKEERITIYSNHGIQVHRIFLSGKVEKSFIPLSKILDVFVLEGFHRQRIIFYIAIATSNSKELILPFRELLPRLKPLMSIYLLTRHLLFDEAREPAPHQLKIPTSLKHKHIGINFTDG